MAEAITTAASALPGKYRSSAGAVTSSKATLIAPTTPVNWLLAPAASATGVRDELLLMGKPWKNPAARLATPSPTSSWLGLT
jgi:hypothetical protein